MVFLVLPGTARAWWKGDWVWWVSLVACRLSAWKSMVLLRDLFFLVHITIRWHQVSGVSRGTFSNTPRRTSLSRPALTSSCQWMGMAMGVWHGLGVADGSILDGSILRRKGGPDIMGRGWCSHMLNALAAYNSRRYCSSFPLLASVAGWWVWGVGVLLLGMSRSWGVGTVFPPLHGSPLGCCFLVRG